MAFDGGIAASYLASFRPVTPVEGFENVLSNTATSTFGLIPFKNMELQGQLANTALAERGATNRQQIVLDAQAEQNDITRRANRRTAALQLAGQMFGMGAGDVATADPLQMKEAVDALLLSARARRADRTARPYAGVAAALRSLTPLS